MPLSPRGRGRVSVLLLPLILCGACSDDSLSLFFDIPPPTEEEKAAAARSDGGATPADQDGVPAGAAGAEAEPPAIEAVTTWEQAQEMLPKDDMDQANWVEALETGIIQPRDTIGGPPRGLTATFKFDFYLPGPDPSFDAFFPHSVHTEWLGCESCHPKIFPRRGTEITMDEVFAGAYCGACHGKVAFGLDSCARCHTAME